VAAQARPVVPATVRLDRGPRIACRRSCCRPTWCRWPSCAPWWPSCCRPRAALPGLQLFAAWLLQLLQLFAAWLLQLLQLFAQLLPGGRRPGGRALVAVARGPWPPTWCRGPPADLGAQLVPGAGARVCVCVTWCLVFVYSVHKHGPADLVAVDLVAVDLVAVDLVAVDLVAVDLVAVDLVAADLVPGPVARVTWCAPWWPGGRVARAARPGARPGGRRPTPGCAGAQKTGRVASCAGISPFSHGQFHVKQFSAPAIKGPLCQQTQLVSKYLKI